MRTSTITTAGEVEKWFTQNHVTITFTTESGSRYTLVCRPKVVVLIKDNTGEVWQGTNVVVRTTGKVLLCDKKTGVWETTRVTSFYVATN